MGIYQQRENLQRLVNVTRVDECSKFFITFQYAVDLFCPTILSDIKKYHCFSHTFVHSLSRGSREHLEISLARYWTSYLDLTVITFTPSIETRPLFWTFQWRHSLYYIACDSSHLASSHNEMNNVHKLVGCPKKFRTPIIAPLIRTATTKIFSDTH